MPHEILKPLFEREDHRGVFRELLNQDRWESLVCGAMNPGAVMGNHYHKQTTVFFYLTKGSAHIKIVNVETLSAEEFQLEQNEGVILNTLESHGIEFLEPSEFIMLKSLKYDSSNPDTYHFPVKD
jgi:dTDP-4-dehydrorhamnose 3,5-epimerase-like enzyme